MALDTSIPLQTQAVNPMASLSSVLGIKNQQAQLQGQQQQNQQGAIALQERQGVQGVLANIKKYQDAQGNIDFNKLSPDVMAVAPTTGAQVLQNVAQAQSSATDARSAVNKLDKETRTTVGEALYSLKGQDPMVVHNVLTGLKSTYPNLVPAVEFMGKYLISPTVNDPDAMDKALDQAGRFVQTATAQQSMQTPEGVTVNNGASTKVVSTKPGTIVPAGQAVPGTEATLRPGPTTGTVDQAGTQGIVGAPQADFSGVQGPQRSAILADIAARAPGSDNAREAVNVLSGRPQGFVPQSLPAGQAQNIANNVDEMNRHFASLNDASSGAALQQGLIGNIKALAPQAATGTGAGRKAFISGLLAAMHIPDTGDEAKNTDLLEKNMAQLNLSSPASTDAMRTIVSAARPHGTMQEGAIIEAADQLSGQISANMAIRNALQGYKMMGDVQGYANARQKLEQIADPRAFQFEAADDAGRRKLLAGLTSSDRSQLRDKIQQLEQMGLVQERAK